MSLSVESVAKRFGEVVALTGVDLSAADGELLVIVGPSGSGKTTLLRCIAGLEEIDSGRVSVAGRDVTGADPGDRDVAMVFQEYALYPHLTVRANIAFGLKARKVDESSIERSCAEVVELLGLQNTTDRRPAELSGGERQRVALARAIVREPALFLMDEPLANLDAELRTHTRGEIKRLQKRIGTTMLYVTHDQIEAMTMGDSVAVMRAGTIEQIDSPLNLYNHPANAFVARFIGHPPMNVFPAEVLSGEKRGAYAGIRPERLRLGDGPGSIAGEVELVEPIGGEVLVHLSVDSTRLIARIPGDEHPPIGTSVNVTFGADDVFWFEGPDGKTLA
ncbi:MAG TPA: ABC transporter ATP-binding protein [Actinomycetota bacterium]|nr:ABC transporter ATP-binding protein [Actinomycetota bacterium]